MISTVVFDLDDTLYDEIDYCRSGFRAVARFIGKVCDIGCSDEVFGCLWRHFTAGNRTETFNAALDELDLPHDEPFIVQLIEVFRTHRPDLALPAESRRTLDALKADYALGLITDGYLPGQRLKVEALGLDNDFKAIIYTEALGRACWKPSPAGFQRLAETLGAPFETMVYVGDNERKDFLAPNQLGMLTVQMLRPQRLHRRAGPDDSAKARFRIARIEDLPGLLVRY